jgi:hypothetical protein
VASRATRRMAVTQIACAYCKKIGHSKMGCHVLIARKSATRRWTVPRFGSQHRRVRRQTGPNLKMEDYIIIAHRATSRMAVAQLACAYCKRWAIRGWTAMCLLQEDLPLQGGVPKITSLLVRLGSDAGEYFESRLDRAYSLLRLCLRIRDGCDEIKIDISNPKLAQPRQTGRDVSCL